MIFVRVVVLLALFSIGGALLAWMWTGDARYRMWAWHLFRGALVLLLVILVLFAVERVIGPLG